MPKVTYACVDCGKERTAPHWNFEQPEENYRCKKCALNFYKKPTTKITSVCIDCGKKKILYPSEIKKLKYGIYRCQKCASILSAPKRANDPVWIENNRLQLERLHNDPIAQANQKQSVSKSARTPEWNENNKAAMQKLQTDPIYIEKRNAGYKKRSENEEWLKNITESNRNKVNDPIWIANQKLGIQKSYTDSNPTTKENRRLGYEKLTYNPTWRANNKKAMQLRALDPIWIIRNKEFATNRTTSPVWRESNLIAMSGQGFWYGHPILHNSPTVYCEIWKDVNQRVHAFFNYECCLCGEKEMGISHVGHHVFYVKEACCWSNESGEYYTNLNVKTHRKDEYYIGDNPNYFVILCQSCHGKTNGKFENRKKWADYFKNMIDEEYNGKCYFTKEEYEIYNFNKK